MQQPFAQEVASQVHRPVVLSHSWPDPHDAQVTPPVPQEPFDSDAYGSHVLPLQQPAGQDAASHTHCPVVRLHSWPVAHAPQVAPPAPHDVFDSLESASQDPPVQQPAQDEPPHVHAPIEHESPLPHTLHAAPAVPHWLPDCEAKGTHVLPLQQPAGHEVASQTHFPLEVHSSPDGQAAQVAPPVPHEVFDSEP